ERIAGIESTSNPSAPAVPSNKILVTFMTVTDGEVGNPSAPITGSQFKQKNESSKHTETLTGTNQVIQFATAGQQHYVISGAVTSVAGFGKTTIDAWVSSEVPYSGKDIFVQNLTDHEVTLKHDFSGVDVKFLLGADLVVPASGIVWLKYDARFETLSLFFKSWSEVDLSNKADLVGGKVPSSQLPSYVDDVLEFADLAAFPIAGETGKIYVDLSTNLQYRWSGSAYVPMSSSETFEQSTWMFSDFFGDSLNQLPFVGAVLNGGSKDAGVYSNGTGGYIGSHILFSGVSANGGYRYTDTTNPAFGGFPSKNGLTFYGIFKLISQSDARDRVIRIGFHNATTGTATPTNGAFLEILGSTATFKTKGSGLETASSPVSLLSGASSSGVFYKILIEFISTTSVNCKVVDDSNNIVLEVNHTTNIPSSGQRFGCGLVATITTAGTNHQIMSVDYMGVGRQKPNFLNDF
ncbi:MAG: hypothetical protein ACK4M1_11185, partial [Flavobacterium sp.]